ncbi:MAG: aldehyde dehydrogenase [Phycisphaerae bacterium]|nr:MAG: aldehyde dehydrogenase [Phycisphaerae bacterium]
MSRLRVLNPFDQSVVGEVATLDLAQLKSTIDVAHQALSQTRVQPPHERAELLLRIADRVREHKTELACLIVSEAGKPITLAEAEVDRAIITFTSAADEARRWPGQVLDAGAYPTGIGHFALFQRVPIGVVYGMGPFNFPLNLVAHKIAPAIACGAPILLKPSPRTPLSALKLQELIQKSDPVPGHVQVIVCDNELATQPLEDPRVKVVSFTGSATVGWKIKAQAVHQRVTLELGGNAPVILHDDIDIPRIIPMLASGIFANAGQSCISIQRVLIHRPIYDKTRDLLVQHTLAQVRFGDPTRRDVIVGPMISAEARDRIEQQIRQAIDQGARVLCGGKTQGPCLEPTLLEHVPPDHPLCVDEAFAPLAVLVPYDTWEQALQLANQTDYGLQAGIFTHDLQRITQAFERLEYGGILVNQIPTFRIDHLPYGGVKNSGIGREGPRWAMLDMTEIKTLILRTT